MAIKKTALVGYTVNAETPASLLLHFEGVNGSSAFVDSSAYLRTVSAAGNAQISAATSKWTDVSGQFAGDGSYLTLAADESNNLGAGDFTVEFWANLQFSQYSAVLSNSTTAQDTGSYIIGFDNADLFGMFYDVPQFNSLSVDISSYYGAWAHYAFVRSNGVLTFYINGIKQTSVVTNSNFTTALPSTLRIGSRWTNQNNYWLNSYLDDLRITKGLAVYTGNFIPPRGPLTPYVKPEPVAAQASLLLHFDGNFNDSSVNNFTTSLSLSGNAGTSATQSKFGGSSAYFDGNSYITIYQNAAPNLSAGDFTIEFWAYPEAQTTIWPTIFGTSQWNQQHSFAIRYNLAINDGLPDAFIIQAYSAPGILYLTSGPICPAGHWYHVALVRRNLTDTLFINGVAAATYTHAAQPNWPDLSSFGNTFLSNSWDGANSYFEGYIDDFRITKGVAVYTKNFNPPIAPLTPIAAQDVLPSVPASLLLRFDGEDNSTNFKDSSVNALTVTANGNAKISTSQSKWGGSSVRIPANGYLAIPNNSAFEFGTGDFTIEMWYRPDTIEFISLIGGSDFTCTYAWNLVLAANNVWNLGGEVLDFQKICDPLHNDNVFVPFVTETWCHIAVTRKNGTVKIFHNGVMLGSRVDNANYSLNGSDLYIGNYPNLAGRPAGGASYIDDLRIVKGHAVYTDNFTPPTAPLDAFVRPPEGTPASLLLHFDGDFNDSSPNALTVTANGNATISTAQSKWGGMSGYFDGTGDTLQIAASDFSVFGLNDFTVETWLYCSSFSPVAGFDRQTIAAQWAGGGSYLWMFEFDAQNIIFTQGNNGYHAGQDFVVPWSPTPNTWQHVAVSRENGVVRMFLNGQLLQSGTYALNMIGTANLVIGQNPHNNTRWLNGYIDDLRITKGLAVYTGPFVPPTAPLSPYAQPAELAAQASLLLHFDGNFNDSSGNGLTVTANGSATTSSAQSKFGGSSGYFDGNNAYLSIPSGAFCNLAADDFTVEFWYSASNPVNNAAILSFGWTAGYYSPILIYCWNNGDIGLFASSNGASWNIASDLVILSAPALESWHHIAITRSGETIRTFADGVLTQTISVSGALVSPPSNFTVAARSDGTYSTGCYIDDLRITKGLAVYTGNFIPPEAPLSPIAKPKPVEAQSSLLMHFNGANNSTNFKDSSVNALTVTANGGAVISTAQHKFGNAAADLTVTNTSFFEVAYTEALNFGTGDFTVECWVYWPTTVGACLFSKNGDDAWAGGYGWEIWPSGANNIGFFCGDGAAIFGTADVEIGRWIHFAATRQLGIVRVFKDGVLLVAQSKPNSIDNGHALTIGNRYLSGQGGWVRPLHGYIDDLRIVKGLAVYTGNFTPPTKPLTGIASPAPALPAPTVPVDYLVVAGGGSGGVRGGGGGAGGYLESTALALTANTPVTVTVGAGGAGVGPYYYDRGNNGSDSVLGDITAIGGGGGGGLDGTGQLYYGGPQNDGANGGSGGGGGVGWYHGGYGGSGTSGQGYNGGHGTDTNNAQYESCGGGGGASAPGGNGAYGDFQAGDGGAGLYSGLAHGWFCGGGGGGANPDTYAWGAGGVGGGGGGAMAGYAESGYSNSGGGGGGCSYQFGDFSGDGGSGYVCIRFPNTHTLTVGPGLTYTTYDDGTNIAYYFTAGTDTITFTN